MPGESKNRKPYFNRHRHHFSPRKGEVPKVQEAQPAAEAQEIPEAPAAEEITPAVPERDFELPSAQPAGCIQDCPNCGRCAGAGEQPDTAPEPEPEPEPEVEKITIVGVRFKEAGKIYYFDPNGFTPEKGSSVIVETARGIECGTVAIPMREVPLSSLTSELKKVIRVATASDLERVKRLKEQEKEAEAIWNKKIAEHKLEMDLVDVEYTFDAQKLVFYFTAEGRVDFREFVKDLANVFKTRIELRQIGVRDEAKQIGGLGVCGRPFCCKTFLDDFQQVSIKMAKEQNLSLNSVKISGTCGRLMCCLRYENDVYEEEGKKTPGPDTVVMTPDGRGVVTECDVLRGLCKVRLDKKQDLAPETFHRDQLKVLGKLSRSAKNHQQDAPEENGD